MKTAVSLPDELFIAAEGLAKRFGISRSELYQKAIRAFVDDKKNEGVTESLNSVYGTEGCGGRLDPVLERLQGASIAREDW